MIMLACVLILGLALDVRRHRRSRPPAAPPASAPPAAAAPLDPTEDGFPGKDEVFLRLDILHSPEWRTNMCAHYVNEEAAAYEARAEGTTTLIDQPAQIPAHWDYDIHGLGLRKTRLAGDADAVVVLDLERSRFSTRKGDASRYSRFVFEIVFAGEGNPVAWVYYAPARAGHPHGLVWNSLNQDVLSWQRPPKKLFFRLNRRDDRLTVEAATEQGPVGRALDWQDPTVRRPIRQIDLYVQVDRPEKTKKDAPWQAPGRDVYALKAFTVSCADPKGCTIRVR